MVLDVGAKKKVLHINRIEDFEINPKSE